MHMYMHVHDRLSVSDHKATGSSLKFLPPPLSDNEDPLILFPPLHHDSAEIVTGFRTVHLSQWSKTALAWTNPTGQTGLTAGLFLALTCMHMYMYMYNVHVRPERKENSSLVGIGTQVFQIPSTTERLGRYLRHWSRELVID